MLGETLEDLFLVPFPEGRIVAADGCRGAEAELVARDIGRHLRDEPGGDLHRVLAIALAAMEAAGGLRGGAVDDGDEVICDDQAVFAFPCGVLRNEALLDDCHWSTVY